MKHSFTLMVLVVAVNLYGQRSDTTTFVKLYSNFYLFEKFRAPLRDYQVGYSGFEFGGISPAIQWAGKRERKYHELELSVLSFKRNEDEIRILKEREFSLRYEFGKRRPPKNADRAYWQRGWSLRTFIYSSDSEPLLRNGIPTRSDDFGFTFSYVPRYNVRLSSKFQVEANLILGFSLYATHAVADSPQLTDQQRDQWIINFDLLDEIPLRLGVAYRL